MTISNFSNLDESKQVDFAIIGAGISGLYCALRLSQAYPTKQIAIIERLNRTGGRLDTDLITVKPGEVIREEEGGMRFQYSMTELMALIKEMGLCDQIVPFPMASDIQGYGNTNRFYLRGRSFTAHEAQEGNNQIWSEIYNLEEGEKRKGPADIIHDVYTTVLTHNNATQPDEQTPDYWTMLRNKYNWKGTLLRDWQMWGLLRDMDYSEECVQMLSESIGFAGPFKAPINAGDAFQILADFPKDPKYFSFKRGFSTLPNAVRDALPKDRVSIMLSTNVNSIARDGEGFKLKLTEAPKQQNSTPNAPCGEQKSLSCSQIVMASATKGMEDLFATSPAFNEGPGAQALWDSIHSARGMRLMKINLYFDQPWWLDPDGVVKPPVQFGPNFSNLPLNSIYPFYSIPVDQAGSEQVKLTADEETHYKAAALTMYCDFDNSMFWQGLQNVGEEFSSPLQEKQSKPPQTLYPASKAVVAELRKQLSQLFCIKIDSVPEPILTSYRLWDGDDDFEFAYHQWRLGVNDVAVRDHLAAPIPNVFFCNEAISDMQGWVNGSLRSCDKALACMDVDLPRKDGCTAPKTTTARPRVLHTGLWGV